MRLISLLFSLLLAAPSTAVEVVAPENRCHLQLSATELEREKLCTPLNEVSCGKKPRDCIWRWGINKCHSIKYTYCTESLPGICSSGVEAVEAFPPKLPKRTPRFKCIEKSPIKAVRIK